MRLFDSPTAALAVFSSAILATASEGAVETLATTSLEAPIRNIAVIGAGAGGASTAYYLRKFADEANIPVNVTIFEKTNRVGGRSLTVNAWGKPEYAIELGASMFVPENEILLSVAKEANLGCRYQEFTEGSTNAGVWNGEEFVYRYTFDEDVPFWDRVARFFRFGLDPLMATSRVSKAVDSIKMMYSELHFPFQSLDKVVGDVGLTTPRNTFGSDFLKKELIMGRYVPEVVQSSTRVNFGSNLDETSGMDMLLSIIPNHALQISGGNWRIFDYMVQKSKATLNSETDIGHVDYEPYIRGERQNPNEKPYYIVRTKEQKKSEDKNSHYGISFDDVVFAAPMQFSHITSRHGMMPQMVREIVPYRRVHVTVLATMRRPSPKFFKVEDCDQVPDVILTTLPNKEIPLSDFGVDGRGEKGFYSIMYLRRAMNPVTGYIEYIWKITSPNKPSPEFLSELFNSKVPESIVGNENQKIGKLIFGSENQEALIELPQGQLYLVRPQSPKGYSELIFKDSAARIRRTGVEFQYQLVVQRVYEEGEEELLAEEGGDDEIDAQLASERDEKSYLLDEALHFRVETREGSETVLAWRDLSGDTGDVYEFICDSSVPQTQIAQFQQFARHCQYERKYRKPYTTASEFDLKQFDFDDDLPIPPASPIHSPTLTRSIDSTDTIFAKAIAANTSAKRTPPSDHEHSDYEDDLDAQLQAEAQLQDEIEQQFAEEAEVEAEPEPKIQNRTEQETAAEMSANETKEPEAAATSSSAPTAISQYATVKAELHFFDFVSGTFVLKDDNVTATVTEVGTWEYWLQILGNRDWVSMSVSPDVNPVFNFEYLSFIFNQVSDDGSANSWLLRFKDQPTMEVFQEGLLRALWEQLNLIKWAKVKDVERDYITDAFNDLTMEDAENAEEEEEEEEESESESEEPEHGARSDDEEEDSDDDAPDRNSDGHVNSQLAVGYKHDRSFVVRGSKIGVFKHTASNNLEFSTNISRVETPGGKLFSPKKVMLHNEDRDLILQHSTDHNKLYRMDLEYGKVVDEWNVHENIPVTTFAPEKKFSQMTGEQTFLGISHNALFRVDPRLSGDKLVDSQLKQYASKNDFSALASTEKGYVAVASNKGDIRLFDRLGINAKTHIPALGEPIIGLDVSADGRWLLATCRTYLLLIDTLQKEGKNEGKLGFERSFAADKKPQPRRLALTPEHVAQFAYETKKGVSFTPARFNTGEGVEESSIITATGPYIIEWNLKKVLKGGKSPYMIKRYIEDVMADNFKFGTDKNVIVALPNEVNMVGKKAFKKPTRESIAGDFRSLGGRRSTIGRSKLGLDDIVESAY
ncbi:Vacuolar import and degradation protein 27 [Ceratocystis platani]|uniref:Vacuolar import and degradation protein 27 n=1 Tax=Ceratocystis fimbriata f. sp. platani TaxID=88771 RepID=A0A0F8AWV9_CERFI|nr:Vacuolar import and degradation protein 27 [Ceratocystis platani]